VCAQQPVPTTTDETPSWLRVLCVAVALAIFNLLRLLSEKIGPLGQTLRKPLLFSRSQPWRTLTAQYILLLVATVIFAWVLGFFSLSRPMRYLPRLAAIPIGIMLLAHSYRLLFRVNK